VTTLTWLGELVRAADYPELWTGRMGALVLLLVLSAFVFLYLQLSKRRSLFIRKLAGIDAVNEAIGRATEMGRPVAFVPGIGGLDSLDTMCGLAILGEITKRCVELNTRLIVLNRNLVVQAASAGIVRDAYKAGGKEERYSEDIVRYLAGDQFAFAAGALGSYKRDKPAANFLFGAFWAESLELAEVGQDVGAIQVAGSSSMAQVPFFVAACDYCLIGEEFYAAAAYIGHDPVLTGSIVGQDWGKITAIALLVIGIVSAYALGTNPWLTKLLQF